MSWFPKNVVVVPIDFSSASLRAVDVGLELASSPEHVWCIHVIPVDNLGDPWTPRREHVANELRSRLAAPHLTGVQTDVLYGDPGSQIAKFAHEKAADLIVLPSHGRTGLAHLLLGSVAERVIRLARCPVLVLRDGQGTDQR